MTKRTHLQGKMYTSNRIFIINLNEKLPAGFLTENTHHRGITFKMVSSLTRLDLTKKKLWIWWNSWINNLLNWIPAIQSYFPNRILSDFLFYLAEWTLLESLSRWPGLDYQCFFISPNVYATTILSWTDERTIFLVWPV